MKYDDAAVVNDRIFKDDDDDDDNDDNDDDYERQCDYDK